MFSLSEIPNILNINLPPSPMYLVWAKGVCYETIRDRSTDFSFTAKTFEKRF